MILVFGGTTEGKQVAKILDELEYPYYYSTKTKVIYEGKGTPIYGEMTIPLLETFCVTNKVTCIINASHPFAIQLHQTIANTSIKVPLIRFQRKFPERIVHSLISYVDSFEEAMVRFDKNRYTSLLALSGVQTIAKLQSYWKSNHTWFRILDRDTSRVVAKEAGFPKNNLIFGYPQSKNEEVILFRKLSPDVVFTKESGSNGKLEEKIEAAIEVNIPIVILKKPKISNRYLCVTTKEELIKMIS
ncbi:precorrin-6A/cobalt-precorrin-6A reductase [Aquimarina sediminis]|uniref:precorrin-6A/cobalt-precorrin-6A reductase n=1 Tax=Aquimarina sediminis TaxID=2070536 RepID=UPI000CA05777|nr:precorrin-6A/cobalt-precorrin-6A reductase [Aquimarina sediminis]